ncbi:hypothetical protein BR93DRAFT_926688 [Coniochaeta sp. PMI_546]|nr:hypothetical protein BR93DRAFT_926688 [Coniochaeta sp. PMI_546]
MPGSTLTQYPLSLSFDAFTPSYQNKNEQYTDFSPSLYSPLDIDEFGTDFTTDSAPSPGSPLSPVVTGLYALPQGDLIAWDKIENSPGLFKTEPFEDTVLSSIPLRNMSLSPAINPMDLTNPHIDDVLFSHEGINDNQPLFQTQFPLPATRTQPTAAQKQPQQPTPSQVAKKPPPPTQTTNKRYLRGNLKRKPSQEEDDEQLSQRSSASPPPNARRSSKDSETPTTGPKKTAHNMIEKRYRNNLNDKIAALRDSVPALRVMVHRLEAAQGGNGSEEGDEGEDDSYGFRLGKIEETEDLGGLAPAHKLNKATILGKATEYIMHLERRNRALAKENAALRNRVEGFEMLVMSRGGGDGMWA